MLPNSAVEAQGTRYSITDMGLGVAHDINNSAQVVGEWVPDSVAFHGGFYWDKNRGRENVVILNENSGILSINDSGEAVLSNAGKHPPKGFIWDSTNGGIKEIFIFPKAINNSGYVTGYTGDGPGGGDLAVVWDETNGIQAIGGGINGNGLDINDSGQVAGKMNAGGILKGFIWDNSNGLQIIPTLGKDSAEGEAEGINNSG